MAASLSDQAAGRPAFQPATGNQVDAAATAPVPARLGYFRVKALEKKIELRWNTLSESNTAYFIIEKSRGVGYQAVDSLAAAGQTVSGKEYLIFDNSPSPGTSHYRLKMVDKDGTCRYSESLQVFFEKTAAFSVYPNPSSGNVTVLHSAGAVGDTISVYNAAGQQILAKTILKEKTFTNLDMQLQPKGVYRVTLSTRSSVKTERLVLQ